MKAKEIKDLTKEDLISRRDEIRSEIFNLKFRASTSQVENPMRVKELRKDIARIETVLRQSHN